jgi:lipopolysaccharide transport system permease protein
VTSVATYRSSRELFLNLTLRELRSKYKRSFLGWAWSLANPLATMLVYTIVFKYFLRSGPKPGDPSGLNVFALFLLCGLLPWNFFSISVNGCISSLIGNSSLIKKTYFPRELLPGATVAAALVSHLIEMGLLLVTLLAFGNWRAVAFLPLVVLLTVFLTLFSLGLGLLLSVLNVYFRDVEHFMGILFMVWFYLTPIIYSIAVVPAKYHFILKLNPMTDAALSYQAMLYDGRFPGPVEFIYFALASVVAFAVGLAVFNRLEPALCRCEPTMYPRSSSCSKSAIPR